jgi:hypothetical protein
MADLINTYEASYSSFNSDSLSGTISKQSVILVNSPTTGSYSTVILQLESKGVAAVYISTASDSSSDLPTQLSEFASEVASVGGVRNFSRSQIHVCSPDLGRSVFWVDQNYVWFNWFNWLNRPN